MDDERVVIFDLGGTLYSYRHMSDDHRDFFPRALSRLLDIDQPLQVVRETMASVMREVTSSWRAREFYLQREGFAEGCRRIAATFGVECDEIQAQAWSRLVLDRSIERATPRAELDAAVTELNKLGIRIGIASNSDQADMERIVDKMGIRKRFDFLMSSEAARACKPSSTFFLRALEVASVRPENAIYVGDSPTLDVVPAIECGMRAILLVDETTLDPDDAWYESGETPDGVEQVSSLASIAEMLRGPG